MKRDRQTELLSFASNLELILKNNNERFVAFTTDTDKFDIARTVGELAKIYSAYKTVCVASYEELSAKVEGVNYITIDAKTDDMDSITKKTEGADIVLVICPNMLTSMSYLSMSYFVKDMVIIAKRWHSKTANINVMKQLLEDKEMTLLGIVYEK